MARAYTRFKSVEDLPEDLQPRVKSLVCEHDPENHHFVWYDIEFDDAWELNHHYVSQTATARTKKDAISYIKAAVKKPGKLLTRAELNTWLKTCPQQNWFNGRNSQWIGCNARTVSIVFPIEEE